MIAHQLRYGRINCAMAIECNGFLVIVDLSAPIDRKIPLSLDLEMLCHARGSLMHVQLARFPRRKGVGARDRVEQINQNTMQQIMSHFVTSYPSIYAEFQLGSVSIMTL